MYHSSTWVDLSSHSRGDQKWDVEITLCALTIADYLEIRTEHITIHNLKIVPIC